MSKFISEGKIIAKTSDNFTVEFTRNGACGACKARRICNPPTNNADNRIIFSNNTTRNIGDNFTVQTSSKDIIISMLNLYLLPTLVVLLTLCVSNIFIDSELYQALIAVITMICSIVFTVNCKFMPNIVIFNRDNNDKLEIFKKTISL